VRTIPVLKTKMTTMGKVMGKLVFFAVLMLVLPIATMFLAQKYLFDGQVFSGFLPWISLRIS